MWQYQSHNNKGFYYGFWTTTYSFEIWYRDIGEGFWRVFKDPFSQINLDSFQIPVFSNFFSKKIFFEYCIRFFFYFMISFERMIPYLSIFLLLFKRSPFHIGTFISFVAMLQRIFSISRYLLNKWSHIYPYFCCSLKGLLL